MGARHGPRITWRSVISMATRAPHVVVEQWTPWPLSWSGVWVGALAAVAALLVVGLIGMVVGAHQALPGQQILEWRRDFGLLALLFSVLGAFLSFALGGWAAARVAGITRSEPAMLHGAVAWLVALPIVLALVALGAGTAFGAWYAGLGVPPGGTVPGVPTTDPNAAIAARNAALGAITALLLSLMGAVVGGWLASGEPMTFTYYRTRAVPTRTAR